MGRREEKLQKLRKLDTSSRPSGTSMGEVAPTINALTWCWRSPAMLPACTDNHWTSWDPSIWGWGGWKGCATGLDGGARSAAFLAGSTGTRSLLGRLITCYAVCRPGTSPVKRYVQSLNPGRTQSGGGGRTRIPGGFAMQADALFWSCPTHVR